MNKYEISIVVPIYKVPYNLLRKCIESLIVQKEKNIEIILVDDGSPDLCGKICDDYAKKDERIIVVHQKNKGLCGARNAGVNIAKGKWICFVDGDDYLSQDAIEQLKDYLNNDVDVILFEAVKEFNSKKIYFDYESQYKNGKIYSEKECKYIRNKILDFNGYIGDVWGKLYNNNFLKANKLMHDEDLKQGAESLDFNFRVFDKAKKIQFINKCLYHYIYNNQSITIAFDEKNYYYILKCFEKLKEIVERQKEPEILKLIYNRLIYVIITVAISGYFSPNNKQSYKEKKKKYNEFLQNKLIKETLNTTKRLKIDKQRKIIIFCIKHRLYLIISLLATIRNYQKNLR